METDGHRSPGFSATAHHCVTQICSYAIGKLGMMARWCRNHESQQSLPSMAISCATKKENTAFEQKIHYTAVCREP